MTPPLNPPILANPSILAVRDVTMRFGGIVALDDVSFEMEAGQLELIEDGLLDAAIQHRNAEPAAGVHFIPVLATHFGA